MRTLAFLLFITPFAYAQEIIQASVSALPEISETSGLATFQVELDKASTGPVVLSFATKGHDAQANQDFVPRTEVLTFSPGEVLKMVEVVIIDDLIDEEPEELFQADIVSSNPNVVVIKPFALVKIIDNEEFFDIQNVTVTEPDVVEALAEMEIRRDFPSTERVILQIASVDQSAKAGEDYAPYLEQVVFQPEELSKTLKLKVLGDKKPELKEFFSLQVEGIGVDIQMKNPLPMVNIEDADGVLAVRFDSKIEMAVRGSFSLHETFSAGPVRLSLARNEGEEFYYSGSVVPAYKFFIPGRMTFPSSPGEFSIKKLSGVSDGFLDVESAVLHYVIGPRELKCRFAAPPWVPCNWPRVHGLMRVEDIHPNSEQLPGINMLATGFEKVEKASEEGVIVGRKSFEGAVPLPDPNVDDAEEDLVIEIMLIEDETN